MLYSVASVEELGETKPFKISYVKCETFSLMVASAKLQGHMIDRFSGNTDSAAFY